MVWHAVKTADQNKQKRSAGMRAGKLTIAVLLVVMARCEWAATDEDNVQSNRMLLGVDSAGSTKPVYNDTKAQQAFEALDFDFLSHHVRNWRPLVEDVHRLDAWARGTGHAYVVNTEGAWATQGSPGSYDKPGKLFQMPRELFEFCLNSPYFLGLCYDEAAHCVLDGGWESINHKGRYAPFLHDASGETLEAAYAGNFNNLKQLMSGCTPGLAARARSGKGPVVLAELVLPVMHHVFARAGIALAPKYLKESISPVQAAMTLGAVKEYHVPCWACLDLWWQGRYPGHTPEELESALLLAYWTGAECTYIENFAYRGSLYSATETGIKLSALGRVARDFKQQYMPRHPRRLRARDFAPTIVIVRFPDTDWGQQKTGTWISGNLYGAPGLKGDAETRDWLRIWHIISHGQIPQIALSYNNPRMGDAFKFFCPTNNVAVYDHLASDPTLFASAKLVFLTGKLVSPECLATLARLVKERGLTVVTPKRLLPAEYAARLPVGKRPVPSTRLRVGHGCWLVAEDVTAPEVVALLKHYLGAPDQLRFVFGKTEVVFGPGQPVQVMINHAH